MTLSIAIAGGGTGGHLFPAIAIAQEFTARDPNNSVLFISAGKDLDKTVLSRTGFAHKWIAAEGIKGRGLSKQAVAAFKLPKSIFESIRILGGFKPDLVVGVGSYVAGPVVATAWLLRSKIVLHEQNMVPGITNRMLAPFADRIYVSFEKTGECFNPKKRLVTGNPVRKEILNAMSQQAVDRAGFEKKKPVTVLIIGGSQGARSINTAIMDAAEHLKKKDRFFFIHQTGSVDEEEVTNSYRRHGISHTVQPFFYDMENQYQRADLVICRAGATTVAEVAAMGKSVIFIPFPFAADNHQALNAQSLAHIGAAEMILQKDLDGKALAGRMEYYASNPEALRRMGAKAKEVGKPDAAKAIVDDCYRLMIEN